MQFITFRVKQRPGVLHDELHGGAFCNCYLNNRTYEDALHYARAQIEDDGWEIVNIVDHYELHREDLSVSDSGLPYYEQALIDGEVLVYNCYPLKDEIEHAPPAGRGEAPRP